MCLLKTNEYTQTTLIGRCGAPVRDALGMNIPMNLPQVGNLESNNMASTNVCRLDAGVLSTYSLQYG